MVSTVFLAALIAGAPAGDVKVDVGKGNFSAFPALTVKRDLPSATLVAAVERILTSGACRMPGQTSRRFDITVPYAVEVTPDGSTRHVIVADQGCPALEKFVGEIVLKLGAMGDFAPYKSGTAKWYSSEINFTQQ
jgi:hypothetical protein